MITKLYNSYIQEHEKLIEVKSEIDNIFKIGLNAFLLSLFIISAPFILLINFSIMYMLHYPILFLFLFWIILYLFDLSIRLFYYQQIIEKTKAEINYKVILLFKPLLYSVLYLIAIIVLLTML